MDRTSPAISDVRFQKLSDERVLALLRDAIQECRMAVAQSQAMIALSRKGIVLLNRLQMPQI
jgi:hypothetical protein